MWESYSFSFISGWPRGGFHLVLRQIFLFCFIPSLSSDTHSLKQKQKKKKAQKLRPVFFCEVFSMRELKRYFRRRSTKQQRQVHPGDTFQPRGLTLAPPDPPDRLHFLTQAALRSFAFGSEAFTPKLKEFKVRVSARIPPFLSFLSSFLLFWTPLHFFKSVFISGAAPRRFWSVRVSPHVNMQSLFYFILFLYILSTLYCALRCEKYIGKIKISTVYCI